MQPKLSVIIPVYNMEKYIRQCLDSVYSQTFRDFEVIIIDDGSPDNCGKICDEYAKKFGNEIHTNVIHKKNAGLPSAWNDGLSATRGEWITFVDSDDWLDNNYYETMFNALGNQAVDVFCAGVCYKNTADEQTRTYCFDAPKLYRTREERDYMMTRVLVAETKSTADGGQMILGVTQAPWDKFYRAEFIRSHNITFESSLGAVEDVMLNLIVFDQADCVGVSTVCGYHYRQVEQSYTRRFSPKRKQSFIIFLNTVNDYLAKHDSNPIIKKALNAYALSLILGAIGTYFCNKNNPKTSREIAKEFVAYKRTPCFAEAIHDRNNPYMSFKIKIWQFIFKLPGFAFAKFVYKIKNR